MVSLRLSLVLVFVLLAGAMVDILDARPRRILVDTDLDVDDIFGLIYLLKQNRSEFDVQAITVSANGWTDAGHAVNHLYDILFSMNRDDIPVGVGGEGGIWPNGTIEADVGGYLPIIDQGLTTAGGCRYRQAIPPGQRGRLDINTNYGLQRKFLPQGDRKYTPLRQATAQQVIKAAVSGGPITVILMGSHTNFALFLITNPHLKKNVEQIFAMGGAIESDCLKDGSFEPRKCSRIGNLYPPDTNPYAEFNIFADPFAAYKDNISGKAILVSPTGWATAATIDLVYDVLHMMGRDDIPVGLGKVFAVGQKNPSFSMIGDCQYRKAIPHGSGGFLDSDTLYGLAGYLQRGPRRYVAESSVHFGAPWGVDNAQLRQPLALEVWNSVVESLELGTKVTILTNGPLTNLAQILNVENSSSVIQDVFILGAHTGDKDERGNLFTVPSNKHAEFNMFLDPLAAKAVFESKLNITIIPLSVQRRVSSFRGILGKLKSTKKTPEAKLAQLLLRRLWLLQQHHHRYHHMNIFLGEILGAVALAKFNSHLKETFDYSPVEIIADGNELEIGRIVIDEKKGKSVRILKSIDENLYYEHFAKALGSKRSYSAKEIDTGNWRGAKRLIMFLKASYGLWPVQLGVFFFFLCVHVMVFVRTRL